MQETARYFVSLESLDKTWPISPWICMKQCIDETEDPNIHNMTQKFINVPLVKKVNEKNGTFRQPVLLVAVSMQQNKEDIFL